MRYHGVMRTPPLLSTLLGLLAAAGCARADRIELRPATVRFVGKGKSTVIHATPYEKNGRHIPDPPCGWSSSDERVVTVAGEGNDATLTSVAAGRAAVRCTIGGARAELPVEVRLVARISVRPDRAELKVSDAPAPLVLSVEAWDDEGVPLASRSAVVLCASEDVCRGDARGQVWPVGPGETTARVEIEGAGVTIPVKVEEGRSADGRPKAVKGNPMLEIERKVRERERAEAAAREKAAR